MKTLVTCPECNTDQHVYANAICNHTGPGGLRCTGSRDALRPKRVVQSQESLEAQLKMLTDLAKNYGLNDAHNWLLARIK